MGADIRRVALLMSCLPRRLATSLIDRLPEEHGHSLRHCLDELTDVDETERQQVVHEFLNSIATQGNRRYRVDAAQSQPSSFNFTVSLPPARILELLQDEMFQKHAVVI